MPPSRRLPSSVFTLVAVLVTTLAAAWWVSAAPPGQAATSGGNAVAPATRVVLVDLGDGRIRPYLNHRSENVVARTGSSCRGARRAPYRSFGSGQADRPGPRPSSGARVGRPWRCVTR